MSHTITSAETITSALADPIGHATELAAIFNARGPRDAALALTAQSGDWTRLKVAAAAAEGRALAMTGVSPHGARTVLAVALWVEADAQDPLPLLLGVPEGDPARRMADLVLRLWSTGDATLAAKWLDLIRATSVAECLAFQG